jgi:hypothetical protein
MAERSIGAVPPRQRRAVGTRTVLARPGSPEVSLAITAGRQRTGTAGLALCAFRSRRHDMPGLPRGSEMSAVAAGSDRDRFQDLFTVSVDSKWLWGVPDSGED